MKYLHLTILLLALLVSVVPLSAQDTEFPITIEHKYGSTIITEQPKRVVAIGFTDQDPLLALGVKPLAVRYWYGDETDAIFPWAEDEAEGAQPTVFNMTTLNYEAILTLNPDLIIAIYSGITEDDYKALSQIAPTVAQLSAYTDYGMPWQETARLVGAAVGESDQAETLISNTEALITDARDQNPVFAGKSIAVVYAYQAGSYGYYTAQDPRGRFFTDLGFVIPEDLLEIAGDSYYADLSPERVDLLDRDLIVVVGLQFVAGGREEIESDPLLSQLKAVKEGRILYVPGDVDDALQFNTVLSLPYLLEHLVPELQAVVGTETPIATEAAGMCEAGFRLFEDENLVQAICVPETAERIVTLDPFYSLQMSLEMDLPVIGAAAYAAEGGFPDNLSADDVAGIELIGGFEAPNLEAITALNPDLIIGDAYFHTAQYDLFNAIAPTVLINTGDWKAWYHLIAEAAGVPERAEAAFDEYNARIADLQALLPEDVTVSFLRVTPDGFQLYREAPNAYAPVAVMSEAGIIRPAFESGTDEESFARLDYEGLANIEGDILLYVVGGSSDDGEQLEADTLSNPIWQALPAVQAEQAYRVDAGPWMSFGGLDSAHAVLDNLFRYVAGVDPQEVSPNPFLMDETSADATPEATQAN